MSFRIDPKIYLIFGSLSWVLFVFFQFAISYFNQSLDRDLYEVILVDDCSSDDSIEVANSFKELKNSTVEAIEIAGMPRIKENLAASFFSHPDNRAIEMVAPERDTPGIIANACAIPIKKLSRYVWFLILMDLLGEISAKNINKAIKIETIAIEKFERKNES